MKDQGGSKGARRALIAACAFALAIAGCGDSGDDGSADASADEQVRAVLEDMGAKMKVGDAAGACALMTEQGRSALKAQAAQLPSAGDGDSGASCEVVFGALLASDQIAEDLSPKITDIAVEGDSATVTAKASGDDRPQQAKLEKRNGRWRVATWYAN